MSPIQKERVVHACLAALTLWPLVHIGLVWRFDLSPWKLAGWGMYSAPRLALSGGMELYGHDPATDRWEQIVTPSDDLNARATAFLLRHRWLRRLTDATPVADAVAADNPTWDRLRLVIGYTELDRDTGRIVLRWDERVERLR
jgi:hypothetical protein